MMEIDGRILSSLIRYIDRYGWSWNMARRLVNRTFGAQYTEKQLKQLYWEKANGKASSSISPPPQA